MAEIMGRPKPAEPTPEEARPEEALVPPVEEAFGWTAFGEVEIPPEVVPAVEEALLEKAVAPPVEEVLGEVEAPPEAVPAVEETPPIVEAAPPKVAEWPRMEEVEVPPVVELPTPVVTEVPGVVEMEISEPVREAIAPPEIPTVGAPAEPFAAERAYLKEHPRDYEAWLVLARALWQAGEREDALEAYSRLIRSGKLLESVIPDLEKYLEQWPEVSTRRVLGDAYMKDGRLQEALDIYREALEAL